MAAVPKELRARYVIEVWDAVGARLLFTAAAWTVRERATALKVIQELAHRPGNFFPKLPKPEPVNGRKRRSKGKSI